jgi:hypothetical protein
VKPDFFHVDMRSKSMRSKDARAVNFVINNK